jgi:tripartite-type tricarboxylate transporter receptor subunit TctC
MRFLSFRSLALALAVATSALVGIGSAANAYPDQPIKIIVPFPAGGIGDLVARLLGSRMSEHLGQPVIIENRTGASGTIGVGAVVHAKPDGYTLLVTTGDFVTVPPEFFPEMSFDPHKALMPVMRLTTVPLVLLANADAPFTDIPSMISAAKANPGKFSFSTPGPGTINQLAGEWLASDAHIKLLQVPYRGGVPAANAIASGEVQMGVSTWSSGVALIQSGRVRALGLMTKDKPDFVKDMKTVAEQAFPDFDADLMVGLYAPVGTPHAIIDIISKEVRSILADKTIAERINTFGMAVSPLIGNDFSDYIDKASQRYATVARLSGVKPVR